MSVFDGKLRRHFWGNIHKTLVFLCIASFGTFITLSPIYAAVAIPIALTYGLTIAVPAVFFLIASVCQMFCNPKDISQKVARKIVHLGKIFYNLGLAALGTGLFFIGVLHLFFPGLVALVGLSSLVWIIGFTSSVVGMLFIYRSYKNLKTGSVSDAKRYILEVMGSDEKDCGYTKKIFEIVQRNIDDIKCIVKQSINLDASNEDLRRRQTAVIKNETLVLNYYKATSEINDTMDRYQNILIFNIVHDGNPKVNNDEHAIELAPESQNEQLLSLIKSVVQQYKEQLTLKKYLSPQGYKSEMVSLILNKMMQKIKSSVPLNEKTENIVNDATRSAEKSINKTLSNFVGLLVNKDNVGKTTTKEHQGIGETVEEENQNIDNAKNDEKIKNNISNLKVEETKENISLNKSNVGKIATKENQDLGERVKEENRNIDNTRDNEKIKNNTNNVTKLAEKEYQYEYLLEVNNGFKEVTLMNPNQNLNGISVYNYLLQICDRLNSDIVLYDFPKNSEPVHQYSLLVDDLKSRIPSAKKSKIRRNRFFLLLGIILTFGGVLSFIYPILLTLIGLSGLVGELFAGVVIICGLSAVYESIKNSIRNYVLGSVIGFERSLYEIAASNSNCNDSDRRIIYNEVFLRLLPFKREKGKDENMSFEREEDEKMFIKDGQNENVKRMINFADQEDEVNFADKEDKEDRELRKLLEEKYKNRPKDFYLVDEDNEYDDEDNGYDKDDDNINNSLKINKDNDKQILDNQRFLIRQQERLLNGYDDEDNGYDMEQLKRNADDNVSMFAGKNGDIENKTEIKDDDNINNILKVNKDTNKQILDHQRFLIRQQERLLKLNKNNLDTILSITNLNQMDNESIRGKYDELEESRKQILKRTLKNTSPVIQTANFMIKQNSIKLKPIIEKVLLELNLPCKKQENENVQIMENCGVGGPKDESMSPTAFKPENVPMGENCGVGGPKGKSVSLAAFKSKNDQNLI